jgi:hypothetical protein
MSRFLSVLLGLATIAGCSGQAQYSQSDNKTTIQADQGTTFSITLPNSPEPAPKPVFSANLFELVSMNRDESGSKRVYVFRTRSLGDGDIRIGSDFSIHVNVLQRPGMRSPY